LTKPKKDVKKLNLLDVKSPVLFTTQSVNKDTTLLVVAFASKTQIPLPRKIPLNLKNPPMTLVYQKMMLLP